MHLTHRTTCRVCGSSSLRPVLDLGEQYLQGSFVRADRPAPPNRRISTVLVRCDPSRDEKACGLVQLTHSVPPEILYSVYWYRSGTNNTMREHLRSIVADAMGIVERPSRVLDIGCNDGTLLSNYPQAVQRYGVDPSDAIRSIKDEVKLFQETFPSPALSKELGSNRLDVITSIAMFYDLEDPVEFVRQIKSLLAPDGLWIFEVAYLPLTLKLNSYDTICHEHLEYYSLAVLENIVGRAGMKVVRAALNGINGGSIRCFATHAESARRWDPGFARELGRLRQEEFDMALDTDAPYEAFRQRCERSIEQLRALLVRFREEGKRVHVYGASTKGNTILQACGIDAGLVECAADRNPDKNGARTLVTNIPIVSEEESRRRKPDYYLVLPWHFRREFLEREHEALARGVGMIFPLPELEVYTASGSQRWDEGERRLRSELLAI